MPRTAACVLIWLPEQETYELRRQGDSHPLPVDNAGGFARLVEYSSFAFQGRHGRLTLRREARPHSTDGYWYAYRSHGHKTLKRYAGRSADLTIARLEEIAADLSADTACIDGSEEMAAPSLSAFRTTSGIAATNNQPGAAPAAPLASPPGRTMPLLAPKISLPRLPTALVPRERLLARLDAGLEGKLTLLCAPAGFGKTTLASQWIAALSDQEQRHPAAWISLDSGDNDPVRFWSYVIAACQTMYSGIGQTALAVLYQEEPPTFEQRWLETALTLLLNELSQFSERKVLVLEDYHAITLPQIHVSLAFLLDHLPTALHIVMLTRAEPSLPLAKMRAGGAVNELGAEDLRLSRAETSAFLQQTLALAPTPEIIAHLDAHIAGWVTGLRLLSLSLQGQPGEQALEQRLATFSGSQRHLLEYFVTEVLETQPEELQTFLLKTSLLNDLTASLCDAVTGDQESEQTLQHLERANLFLSPLTGHEPWYRYHPLFAEALRHEAQRHLSRETRRACLGRASRWYEQHGLLTAAIEAAFAAREFAQAAELIEQITGPQRFHEMRERHTLHRWLDTLPEDIRKRHPALCLILAMIRLFASDCQVEVSAEVLAQVEPPLRMAEQAWQAEENRGGLGEALSFRVVIARFQGNPALSARLARQALAWLPENARQWRATCLNALGEEELSAGKLDAARHTFLEAQACFEAAGNHYGRRVALLTLGDICAQQGKLRQAATFYQKVLDIAGEDLSDEGGARLGLARLAYERNNLDDAEAQAQKGLACGTHAGAEALQIQAMLVLAQIQQARGQIELARQQLAALLTRSQTQRVPLLSRQILACEMRLRLAAGDLATPQRWLSTHETDLPFLQQEQRKLLNARLLIIQEQAPEALSLLADLRDNAHQQGRTRDELEALLLMALETFPRQDLPGTWHYLREALTLAHTEGYARIILDEGEPMVAMLRAVLPLCEKRSLATYIRELLLAFSRQHLALTGAALPLVAQSIEPLSTQEQKVLRLLAAGFSNREIAETLVVSSNTVKTQVQSVYRKLGVHSRKEIREAARGQDLL